MAPITDDHMKVMEEVAQMLKTEPSNSPTPTLFQPDIPALQEELAILVSTGKSKEAIAVQLTQEQVKRLEPKDVENYYKRYETYVDVKTTETFVDSFISVYTRGVGMFLSIKDIEALQKDLKKDCHHQRVVHTCQKSCFEMWPAAHGSQHSADHN